MQINLNPTSARGASRDAVNRPRETLGDSHLISSDPRSRFGLVCDLLCCRGNIEFSFSGKFRSDDRPQARRLENIYEILGAFRMKVPAESLELRRE